MATTSPRNKRKQEDTAVFVRLKKFMVLIEEYVPDSGSVDDACPGKSDGEDHQDHPDCSKSVHVVRALEEPTLW